MMMHPRMGARESSAMTAPRALYFMARCALPRVATSCTRPKGALKRMAWKESKPNDLTSNGPKDAMPPEGTLVPSQWMEVELAGKTYEMQKTRENQNHVLGSRIDSQT